MHKNLNGMPWIISGVNLNLMIKVFKQPNGTKWFLVLNSQDHRV